MNSKIKSAILILLTCVVTHQLGFALTRHSVKQTITVPMGGNAFAGANAVVTIDDKGISSWTSGDLCAYVRFENPGEVTLSLNLTVPDGVSVIKVSTQYGNFTKTVKNNYAQPVYFGRLFIKHAGYIEFNITGVRKSGSRFADISSIELTGDDLSLTTSYVKDNHGNFFYWGRRGPSVHLNYILPPNTDDNVEWFYNEVTVPDGNDVEGSYFMADGFQGGYFGMQVNSPSERRILFSVWSPFVTDDPKNIPDSLKVKLIKKGDKVHGGEFGGEGSGGQSYMIYNWHAGEKYLFLVHAVTNAAKHSTVFTAYFKPASSTDWLLMASFERPNSTGNLHGLHSFLENFIPEMGAQQRMVCFGNQWVVNSSGAWIPLAEAKFTGDNTARINYRKDYAGGVSGDKFFLKNCGFFDEPTQLNTILRTKDKPQPHPDIDLENLSKMGK